MAARFQFYEVVTVADCSGHPDLFGVEGAVLGMAEDERGAWSYAVHIYKSGITIHIPEEHLRATGRRDRRESFYCGENVKVRVDPATGEGRITDES
jgi:hypothetical protein